MREDELIRVYVSLHQKTGAMAQAAKTSNWDDFVRLEADSVALLAQIEAGFDLQKLSRSAQQTIATEVAAILPLHHEINQLAAQWRESRIKQFQSDAMAAKVADAYS